MRGAEYRKETVLICISNTEELQIAFCTYAANTALVTDDNLTGLDTGLREQWRIAMICYSDAVDTIDFTTADKMIAFYTNSEGQMVIVDRWARTWLPVRRSVKLQPYMSTNMTMIGGPAKCRYNVNTELEDVQRSSSY